MQMRPEDEEPIDLTAIHRDDALIDALGSGAVAAARAMTDPDDPLIKLIDEYAECAAQLREALSRGRAMVGLDESEALELAYVELAAERQERAALRRLAVRVRVRAALVMTGLVAVVGVGVVVWRGLRR
jgi:hypothetical protein